MLPVMFFELVWKSIWVLAFGPPSGLPVRWTGARGTACNLPESSPPRYRRDARSAVIIPRAGAHHDPDERGDKGRSDGGNRPKQYPEQDVDGMLDREGLGYAKRNGKGGEGDAGSHCQRQEGESENTVLRSHFCILLSAKKEQPHTLCAGLSISSLRRHYPNRFDGFWTFCSSQLFSSPEAIQFLRWNYTAKERFCQSAN
jgi:hypothetical protein